MDNVIQLPPYLVLIGSHALKHYGRLVGREPADYDFLYLGENKIVTINNTLFEYHGVPEDEISGCELYNYSMMVGKDTVDTPVGKVVVAPLEVLKLLKLSCKDYLQKAKHEWDLKNLEDISIPENLRGVLVTRKTETKERVERQKDKFFNKYQINRYFEHDDLHLLINPEPTYLKVLVDAVTPSEVKFQRLSLEDKVSIIREEAFVFVLERDLIPKMKKHPFMAKALINKANDVIDSNDWGMRAVSRLSTPGLVKDHPDWLALWARDNYRDILRDIQSWWTTNLQNLPVSFWVKVLK